METKFNFNSQVCTDRFQSERLLSLGLKKETADMHWFKPVEFEHDYWFMGIGSEWCGVREIPAWSLHRLIEMINEEIQTDWQSMCLQDKGFTKRDELYDNIIDCIEWLIKEGYFPKEYLV